MRPALKAGLLPVWRDRDTVQIGIDPRRAIAIAGMADAGFVIGLLDGSRSRDQVIEAAVERDVPAGAAERILTLLAAGGALDEPPAPRLIGLPQPLAAGLAAELATASLALGLGDGGAQVLARRRAARAAVCGEPRIGRAIARILASAGVGGVTRSASLDWPSGRGTAAGPAANRRPAKASPGAAPAPATPTPATRPDLLILVGRAPQELAWSLVTRRLTHLAVSAAEAIGIVGPLVIPGQTACLRCLDYARARADPAWPLILAQLGRRRPRPQACDSALAAAVAAQAAAQALAAIDRSPADSAAAGGTLELVLPGWQWRRRSWSQHPACPCAGHVAR